MAGEMNSAGQHNRGGIPESQSFPGNWSAVYFFLFYSKARLLRWPCRAENFQETDAVRKTERGWGSTSKVYNYLWDFSSLLSMH